MIRGVNPAAVTWRCQRRHRAGAGVRRAAVRAQQPSGLVATLRVNRPGTKVSSARHRHGFMGGDVREQREQWVGAPPKPPAFFARSLQDGCENESQYVKVVAAQKKAGLRDRRS